MAGIPPAAAVMAATAMLCRARLESHSMREIWTINGAMKRRAVNGSPNPRPSRNLLPGFGAGALASGAVARQALGARLINQLTKFEGGARWRSIAEIWVLRA